MDNRPIGIFDSGVGGLSVYSVVKRYLPSETFVYFADQAHNPYGGRSESEIQELSSNVTSFLIKKKAKLIIVACNTATVSSISYLRERFKIPMIGVVPVVKKIAEETKTGKVAVFSTPATAKSQYLSDLINKFAAGHTVYKIGSSGLEHLIERGEVSTPAVKKAINLALKSVPTKHIDAIALGCTHYPFITEEIKKIVGPQVKIFDSGEAIARRTKQVLQNERIEAELKKTDEFYTSGDPEKFKEVSQKLGIKLDSVEKAEI